MLDGERCRGCEWPYTKAWTAIRKMNTRGRTKNYEYIVYRRIVPSGRRQAERKKYKEVKERYDECKLFEINVEN